MNQYSVKYYAFHVTDCLSKMKIDMSDDLLLVIEKFSKEIILEYKRGIYCKNPNPVAYQSDKYYQTLMKKF